MSAPHDPDSSKWGAIAGIITTAILAVYHFFKAEKSPRVSWRKQLEKKVQDLENQGPPPYYDLSSRLTALERRANHNDLLQDRRHKEIMQVIERLLNAVGLD